VDGKSISEVIDHMARAARSDDATDITNLRQDLVLQGVFAAPTTEVAQVQQRVNDNLGYYAGYLPREYGQKILDWLDIEHPVFGRNLDGTVDEILAAGLLIGEQYREVQLARERKERLAAKRAEGLDVPDVDTAVSSEEAKKLFEALRAKRSGVTLAPVTSDTSAFGDVDPQPREANTKTAESLRKAAELQRMKEAVAEAARAAVQKDLESMVKLKDLDKSDDDRTGVF
jgi:hypothetical protein